MGAADAVVGAFFIAQGLFRVGAIVPGGGKVRRFLGGGAKGIQRLVLLEEPGPKTIYQRGWRLESRSSGYGYSDEDIVALLETLDPTNRSDKRWRDQHLRGIYLTILQAGDVAPGDEITVMQER